MTTEKAIFSWLHLSDIHMGHGPTSHYWDQQLVLDGLARDLLQLAERGMPAIDALFVTGDVAFSGKPEQYETVSDWLKRVASVIRVPDELIFVVPGNHDVQRDVAETNRSVRRLVARLRSGDESVDDALADPNDRELLRARLGNYLAFASRYGTPRVKGDGLYWVETLPAGSLSIRVVGLNTALLSQDDGDHGKLRVGKEQLARTLMPAGSSRDELVVLLTHHPTSWLHDEDEVLTWIRSRVHLHLSGHLHDADSELRRRGAGTDFVRIAAGAAHGEFGQRRHGYSFATVVVRDDAQLAVRLWPRSWSDVNKDFRIAIDHVPEGQTAAALDLRLRLTPSSLPLLRRVGTSGLEVHTVPDVMESQRVEEGSLRDYPPKVPVWVGRVRELDRLRAAEVQVVAVTGIGGQGKSALAAAYVQRAETEYEFWDWRDCREETDKLQAQLINVIVRLSEGRLTAAQFVGAAPSYVVRSLFQQLGQKAGLFVLDNLDHYVDVEASKPIGILALLVDEALRAPHRSKFILTCRPAIEYSNTGFDQVVLAGLPVGEAEELFRLRGVSLRDADALTAVREVQQLTEGHPLWLTLIATQVARNSAQLDEFIRDLRRSKAAGLPNDMLRSIWRALNEKQQFLLRCLAETVRPETEERLEEYVNDWLNWNQYSRALKVLKSLDLVVVKQPPHSKETLELHPLIRQFIRREYPIRDRAPFITRIVVFFDQMIKVFAPQLSARSPFGVLEHWTLRAELAINGAQYENALFALHDVEKAMLTSGYGEEFVRVARRLFAEIDWTDAIAREYDHFDDLLETLTDQLSQLGRYEEADALIAKYEGVIPGKSARFINLCDMRAYTLWLRGDFDKAKEWAARGVELKDSSGLDTTFDSSHNLALARRESNEVDVALEHFMRGRSLAQVLQATNAADAGNVGRCYWYKGEIETALRCYARSAFLLADEEQATTLVNQGWAAQWIAQALEAKGDVETAYWFFRRARRVWLRVAPPKAEAANRDVLRLIEANPKLSECEDRADGYAELQCRAWLAQHS